MHAQLPIDTLLPELVEQLPHCRRMLVSAAPGAGKTTRLPPALLRAMPGTIYVTQPRRLAARMTAERVAQELGEAIGETVGYQIRQDDRTSARSRLIYMTEGLLLRRLLRDATLSGCSCVVVDEFHERNLDTDILLTLIKRLQLQSRPDLHLVVMSATLTTEALHAYLPGARSYSIEGRSYPVQVRYAPPDSSTALEKHIARVADGQLAAEPDGDILVFLPGAREINRTAAACADLATRHRVDIAPLHGSLPPAAQRRAVEPGSRRKLILSTNVAETSVTIEAVTCVIDSGLARHASHSPWTGLPQLTLGRISQASAIQRAGRAGRVRAGTCIRLYPEMDFKMRPAYTSPDIQTADLSDALLLLRSMGLQAETLDWFEAPPQENLQAARRLLQTLGAVDRHDQLCAMAAQMLRYPLHPRLARALIAGTDLRVGARMAALVQIISERSVRSRTQDWQRGSHAALSLCDALDELEAFESATARQDDDRALLRHGPDPHAVAAVRRGTAQLLRLLPDTSPSPVTDSDTRLRRALLTGYADRVGRRTKAKGSDITLCSGPTVTLSAASAVREAEFVVVLDVEQQTNASQQVLTARSVSAIEPGWLLDMPQLELQTREDLQWDSARQRVTERSAIYYGTVAIESSESAPSASRSSEASALFWQQMQSLGAGPILGESWLSTLRSQYALLSAHGQSVSPLDDASLFALLRRELDTVYAVSQLESLAPRAILEAQLQPPRHEIARLLPTSLTLSGGRSVDVHYEAGKDPWVQSYIQDFFGMTRTPAILNGKLPVTMHLLAPNKRAVQVTRDLAGFWQNHYPRLKKELARDYPRHNWPDDPERAQPAFRRQMR